ncbi:MAG: putative lipid II flippase FtsW [Oscillospiraceae bacterium]|nr:putative lipid II flippase FtsW [Oscillospiraceae bacterium]
MVDKLRAPISKKSNKNKTGRMVVRYRAGVDYIFFILVIALLCFGTVMVFSASYVNALEYRGDSFYFSGRQLLWAALGIVVMLIMAYVPFLDYLTIEKFTIAFFVLALGLNFVTPIIGIISHGAPRWLIIGPIQFQPSEILKIAAIMFFAFYASKADKKMKKWWWGVWLPLLAMLLCVIPMAMQQHLSGAVIMSLLCVAMLYISEFDYKVFVVLGILAVILVLFAILFPGLMMKLLEIIGLGHSGGRLEIWRDPYTDPLNRGLQIIQSLYAIGSGGWTGLGLGQSKQKFLYLPEPHNDYIFAILCEELGYIGAVSVILIFCLFIWRGFVIARKAPNKFSSLVVAGITIKVAVQFLLNIAVVTNLLPATGISLPFFSYGGTALVILMAEMGIILSISRYSYKEDLKS